MLGMTHYKGVAASQTHNFCDVLLPFLRTENFTTVIEIGTAGGGLTMFVRDALPKANVITYDIYPGREIFFKENNITYRGVNVFAADYSKIDTILLYDIIYGQEGKLLVMVDGGNKVGEFKAIAPHLEIGDFIMCHDYIRDAKEFEEKFKDNIWNWMEVTEDDIRPTCEAYGLETVYPILNTIVWQCKRKIR